MRLQYCGFTDKGYKRDKNQDDVIMRVDENTGLFVVADGMGGHSMGERASAAVVEYMQDWWEYFQRNSKEKYFSQLVDEIRTYLEQVNRYIYENYNQDSICGTTAVVMFIHHNQYAFFTCGDSRLYLYYKRKLQQISIDDVWENQPEIIYQYTQEEKEKHPDYGKLVTAVGTSPYLQLRVNCGTLEGKEKFLLCSDGLYRMCNEQIMRKALFTYRNEKSGIKSLKHLQTVVYENGAKDNFSVIFLKITKK